MNLNLYNVLHVVLISFAIDYIGLFTVKIKIFISKNCVLFRVQIIKEDISISFVIAVSLFLVFTQHITDTGMVENTCSHLDVKCILSVSGRMRL